MQRLSRALLAVALVGAACEKKPAQESTPPSAALPPLDEAARAALKQDRPVHEPTSGDPHAPAIPPGHPPIGSGGMDEARTPGGELDPKTVISGTITLDRKLKDKVAAGDVIYLVARSADQPGPPLAVKRLTVTSWPIPFSLDSRDAMMEGTKIAGKVIVTGRVDKDGDAMTKEPGDVTGATRPVEPPADKVVLTLDKLL